MHVKHRQLFEDVKSWLDSERNAQRLPVHETVGKDHDRTETRHMALNLPRSAEDSRLSIRRRKMLAGFNDEYRYQVIFGGKAT